MSTTGARSRIAGRCSFPTRSTTSRCTATRSRSPAKWRMNRWWGSFCWGAGEGRQALAQARPRDRARQSRTRGFTEVSRGFTEDCGEHAISSVNPRVPPVNPRVKLFSCPCRRHGPDAPDRLTPASSTATRQTAQRRHRPTPARTHALSQARRATRRRRRCRWPPSVRAAPERAPSAEAPAQSPPR